MKHLQVLAMNSKATPLYQQYDNSCNLCLMPSHVLANLLVEHFEQNVLAIITLETNAMGHI